MGDLEAFLYEFYRSPRKWREYAICAHDYPEHLRSSTYLALDGYLKGEATLSLPYHDRPFIEPSLIQDAVERWMNFTRRSVPAYWLTLNVAYCAVGPLWRVDFVPEPGIMLRGHIRQFREQVENLGIA